MNHPFARPVSAYMSRSLETVTPTTKLDAILEILQRRRFGSVPVVEASGAPVGLVSRTDLVRLGTHNTTLRGTSPSLPMPDRTAKDLMTTRLRTVAPGATLVEAAKEMVEHSVHRLMVVADGSLVGVISTLDLAAAVSDARVDAPLSAWMSKPVVSVEANQTIAASVDLLDRLHISAVVVVEAGWPIGAFSQVEALLSRDVRRDTPVETVMERALICLPSTMRVFRAAGYASQLDVRRVVVTDGHEMSGVLGGLDFARIVAA